MTYAEAQAFLTDRARLSEAGQRARKEAIIDAFRVFWGHVKAPSHEAAMREFARAMDPEVLSMVTKADAGRSRAGRGGPDPGRHGGRDPVRDHSSGGALEARRSGCWNPPLDVEFEETQHRDQEAA